MPLNAQAEIARVLAIEPEGSQADAIRQFVRDELGAALVGADLDANLYERPRGVCLDEERRGRVDAVQPQTVGTDEGLLVR